jgi:hypothetical protein
MKEKGNNDREIVHLIKEPTYIESGIAEVDLDYVLMMAEKIVVKVRRKEIGLERISKIFREIRNYIEMRR